MSKRVIRIGIMPYEEMKARAIAIAKGRHKPSPGEPTIWFTSLRSLASVLSEENQALLQTIRERNPASITELEAITGRAASNLTRTLHTLERYGFVAFETSKTSKTRGGRAPLKPVVLADGLDFRLSF